MYEMFPVDRIALKRDAGSCQIALHEACCLYACRHELPLQYLVKTLPDKICSVISPICSLPDKSGRESFFDRIK